MQENMIKIDQLYERIYAIRGAIAVSDDEQTRSEAREFIKELYNKEKYETDSELLSHMYISIGYILYHLNEKFINFDKYYFLLKGLDLSKNKSALAALYLGFSYFDDRSYELALSYFNVCIEHKSAKFSEYINLKIDELIICCNIAISIKSTLLNSETGAQILALIRKIETSDNSDIPFPLEVIKFIDSLSIINDTILSSLKSKILEASQFDGSNVGRIGKGN